MNKCTCIISINQPTKSYPFTNNNEWLHFFFGYNLSGLLVSIFVHWGRLVLNSCSFIVTSDCFPLLSAYNSYIIIPNYQDPNITTTSQQKITTNLQPERRCNFRVKWLDNKETQCWSNNFYNAEANYTHSNYIIARDYS